jgi:hypothetical protein
MNFMVKAAVSFVVASTFIVTGHCQTGSFGISITISQNTIRTGANLQLQIKVKNISDHDLSLFVPFDETGIAQMFDVNVRDSAGASVPETAVGMHVHGKTAEPPLISGPVKTISPGKEIDRNTDLTRIFDLAKPGTYTVQVTRMDFDQKVLVKSNIITITVTP